MVQLCFVTSLTMFPPFLPSLVITAILFCTLPFLLEHAFPKPTKCSWLFARWSGRWKQWNNQPQLTLHLSWMVWIWNEHGEKEGKENSHRQLFLHFCVASFCLALSLSIFFFISLPPLVPYGPFKTSEQVYSMEDLFTMTVLQMSTGLLPPNQGKNRKRYKLKWPRPKTLNSLRKLAVLCSSVANNGDLTYMLIILYSDRTFVWTSTLCFAHWEVLV